MNLAMAICYVSNSHEFHEVLHDSFSDALTKDFKPPSDQTLVLSCRKWSELKGTVLGIVEIGHEGDERWTCKDVSFIAVKLVIFSIRLCTPAGRWTDSKLAREARREHPTLSLGSSMWK